MRYKKAVLFFLCLCFVMNIFIITVRAEDINYQTSFYAYVLCDSASGQVIDQKASEEPVKNVGLSQLMSILLVLEAIDKGELALDDPVRVSDNAAKQAGSQIFLEAHDTYSVEDLLKGMIMVAANDACMAMAERYAGSEQEFVKMMNRKAENLGMKSTEFVNSTGFNADGEITSARDMAVLARRLAKYPLFFKYSTIWQDTITHKEDRTTDIVNANRVVKVNDKCDGMAVGSSKQTGYSIAASAREGETRFIFIGIGADSAKNRTAATDSALSAAFFSFTSKTYVKANQIIKKDFKLEGVNLNNIALYAKSDVSIMLKKGDEANVKKTLELSQDIKAPLSPGDKVGEIVLYLGEQRIASCDVVVRDEIYEVTFVHCLKRICKDWVN